MLTDWARRAFRGIVEPIARFLGRLGFSPNALTLVGLLLQAGVGLVIALGYLQLGGILLILTALFDTFDGTLARLTGRVTTFGSFFDSTIDRYAEAVVLGGLLAYAAGQGNTEQVLLIYVTIVGSLLVSYTRAKAESLNISCKVGILTRAERVALLALGLILWTWQPIAFLPDFLTLVLWLMAILSNVTAVQRIWFVWKETTGERE